MAVQGGVERLCCVAADLREHAIVEEQSPPELESIVRAWCDWRDR
jgi:hypothetical protein